MTIKSGYVSQGYNQEAGITQRYGKDNKKENSHWSGPLGYTENSGDHALDPSTTAFEVYASIPGNYPSAPLSDDKQDVIF